MRTKPSEPFERNGQPFHPDRALACAVLRHAFHDAFSGQSSPLHQKIALIWLTSKSGTDYVWRYRWCHMANIEPEYFDRKVLEVLTRRVTNAKSNPWGGNGRRRTSVPLLEELD